MEKYICKGVPAWWVNGWLAAVGATVLDSRLRLHWTESDSLAVLSADDCDPVDVLVDSWPSYELLSDLPISVDWRNTGELKRKVNLDSFTARARAARRHPLIWTLSSTMTDLCVDGNGEVAHAPFDPPGPGTIKWLHYRLLKVHRNVSEPSAERIKASLAGEAPRVQDNGLGFDQARIGSQADKTNPRIDPVVEVLAFFGLALLPMRGLGIDCIQNVQFNNARQRGWRSSPEGRKANYFYWPAWGEPLDSNGIDALLDLWNPTKVSECKILGIRTGWRSAAFETGSSSDRTRAYGAERL